MWWFVNKRRNANSDKRGQGTADTGQDLPPIRTRRMKEDDLLSLAPDLSRRLQSDDVAIKIWLPQTVANTVRWFADYEGESQSGWLRQRLIEYTYGRVAAFGHTLRKRRLAEGAIRFSRQAVDRGSGRWVYLVPQLGKNTVAFKLWMSSQMREDLQVLADHAQVGLSPFVRETIIGDLLGRGSLPERPQMFDPPEPAALAWERDEEVPMEEIPNGEYEGPGTLEKEWLADSASSSLEGAQ